MEGSRRPRARSFGTVALGGAGISLLVVAVAVSLYFRYIRYERVAAEHVPPGSVVAARIDVENVALYDPVRRHLISLLGGPGQSPSEAEATLGRLEERTGLKRSDLREIVVARGATRSEWVVILGGIFPRHVSPGILAAALAAENAAWTPSLDGSVVVHGGTGVAVGRGPDGTVLIASSRPFLLAARPQGASYERLGLARTGPGGLAMQQAGVDELRAWPPLLADEDLSRSLSGVSSIRGVVGLTERTSLTLVLTERDRGAAGATIQKALAIARGFERSESDPVRALLREGADRAVLGPKAAGAASVTLTWERAEVDQAFGLLQETIRDHWKAPIPD